MECRGDSGVDDMTSLVWLMRVVWREVGSCCGGGGGSGVMVLRSSK